MDLIPEPRPASIAEQASPVAGDPDTLDGDLGPGNREGATNAPIRGAVTHDLIQHADAFVGDSDQESGGLSRRSSLGRSTTLGVVGPVAGWTSAFVIQPAGAAASSCPTPAGFPAGLELYRRTFRNWSGEITTDDLWSCAPCTNEKVLAVVNWAWQNGLKMRPCGIDHNWSPLLLKGGENCESHIVLVETSHYLTRVRIDAQGEFGLSSVQTGATMEALLKQLERTKLDFVAMPTSGDLAPGSALAIDGHDTGIPAQDKSRPPGRNYGYSLYTSPSPRDS